MAEAASAPHILTLLQGPPAMRPSAMRTLVSILQTHHSNEPDLLFKVLSACFTIAPASTEMDAEICSEGCRLIQLYLQGSPSPTLLGRLLQAAAALSAASGGAAADAVLRWPCRTGTGRWFSSCT